MAAYGLYTHIQSNRLRSVVLLAWLFCLVYLMVFAGALLVRGMGGGEPRDWIIAATLDWYIAGAWDDLLAAFPYATFGAALWIAFAYWFHQTLIDAVTGGRNATRVEQPRLYNLLENLCIARGIPMPRLKVMDTPALNAFASGLNQRQYAVTVTTGLMAHLDDAELEAVLGHELTHIRNGDVRLLVIAVVIAGVIGFFAEMLFRSVFHGGLFDGRSRRSNNRDDDRRGGGGAAMAILISVGLVAIAWFGSLLIRFALSRSREYLADAGAVELTRNPDAMILALRKIEGRGELTSAPSAVMEMCIDNPRSGLADLFATHPSVQDRCDALVRMAGGRDPGPLGLLEDQPSALPRGEAPYQSVLRRARRPWLNPWGTRRPPS